MPKETKTKAAGSAFTIPARDLRDRLLAVIPFAGSDDTMPYLMNIHVEASGGTVFLAATNRHALGVASYAVVGAAERPVPDCMAHLLAADAGVLADWLEDLGRDVEVTIKRKSLRVTDEAGRSVSYPLDPGAVFPEWRSLLHRHMSRPPGELGAGFGLDPRLLARLNVPVKHAGEMPPYPVMVRVCATETGSMEHLLVIFARQSWFIAAIMPVRRGARGDWPHEDWRESWLAATAPAEVTAPAETAEASAA